MKNIHKNLAASSLPQIVNIVSNLILPAILIIKYGSEINGLISTTKTLVAYISIIGAGISTAITQSLYKPVAMKNTRQIKGMLHAADNMFIKFGLIYLVVTGIIAVVYPFIITTNIKYYTVFLLLIVMSISGASEFFITGRCRALLYADQKVYISNIVQAISLLLSLIMAIVMLKLDFNILFVQLTISLVYIFRAGFLLIYVNYKYPQLKNFKTEEPILETVSKRNDALIHQISGLIVTGSQSIILSVILGLRAASIFAVYNIVFSGIQSICSNLSTSVTPYLGKEISLGNYEESRSIYDLIEFAFTLIVTFVFSVAVIMIIPFIKLYTENADIDYVNIVFSVLFAFSSMFYILKLPSTAAVNAAGYFKETRIRALIEVVICIVIGITATVLIGINGILIGTLIALSWRCIDTILYVHKYILHDKAIKSIKRLLTSVVFVGVFTFFSLINPISTSSYIDWILKSVIVSTVSIILLVIVFGMSNKKQIKQFLRLLSLG